jgi:transcriptional regulator with XRE-family HTH domain
MGVTIRYLRKRAGLTQVEFRTRSGMHQNYVGSLERGVVPNPGLATVGRVAVGLDVSIAVLAASFVDAAPLSPAPSTRPAARGAASDGPRELAAAIRLPRRGRGLSQAEVAEAAGLHRSYLGGVEVGERAGPGLHTVARILSGICSPGTELSAVFVDLARVFAGELTLTEFAARVAQTSGSPDVLNSPFEGADT